MPFVVGRPIVVRRASLEHGGTTVYRWEPDLRYGTHATNVAAKRAYIAALVPNLADASDDYIRRWWEGDPKTNHRMKILRVP